MSFRLSATFVLAGFSFLVAACSSTERQIEPPTWQAEVARGKYLARYYGCQTCHEIPHVQGPQGSIGPSLKHIAAKYYLAGQLPNSPENLLRWIQHPHSINPQSLMPNMNVSDEDAADISMFLETLQ